MRLSDAAAPTRDVVQGRTADEDDASIAGLGRVGTAFDVGAGQATQMATLAGVIYDF